MIAALLSGRETETGLSLGRQLRFVSGATDTLASPLKRKTITPVDAAGIRIDQVISKVS
jgi:hypothetical protein